MMSGLLAATIPAFSTKARLLSPIFHMVLRSAGVKSISHGSRL